jgi:hypothetical protein
LLPANGHPGIYFGNIENAAAADTALNRMT